MSSSRKLMGIEKVLGEIIRVLRETFGSVKIKYQKKKMIIKFSSQKFRNIFHCPCKRLDFVICNVIDFLNTQLYSVTTWYHVEFYKCFSDPFDFFSNPSNDVQGHPDFSNYFNFLDNSYTFERKPNPYASQMFSTLGINCNPSNFQ